MVDRSRFIASVTREVAREIERATNKQLKETLGKYLKTHGRPAAQMSPLLERVNRETGILALNSMVQAYESRPRNRDLPSYRSDRYSFGQLYRALNDETNIGLSTTTLSILNTSFMDRNAPQWYRMSFGAGKSSRISVSGMRSPTNQRMLGQSPNLDAFGPSPAFSLPGNNRGQWFRNNDQIHVSGPNYQGKKGIPPIGNLSIDAAGFVQAGISTLNQVYPQKLIEAVYEFLENKR